MQHRLYVGVINHRPAEDGWRNWHLDINPRPIWDPELETFVLPDFVADIGEGLPDFRAEMFDEVVAHHVLEHLPRERGEHALKWFYRILVPGGVLDIEVPDVGKVMRAWLEREIDEPTLTQWLYGEQLENHESADNHRHGWTQASLADALAAARFHVPAAYETSEPRVEQADRLAVRYRAVRPR